MGSRTKIVVTVVALTTILIIPSAVLSPLGATNAGSMIGLGGLGIAFVAVAAGRRVALYASGALGVAALLTVDGAAIPILGVAAMMAVAIGQGISSRWGWHRSFVVLPITLAFITSESILAPPLEAPITFAFAITGYAALIALIISTLTERLKRASDDDEDTDDEPDTPWDHVIGYAAMLAIATGVTTTIVLLNDWGHTGGWLIMTPFIVIQPSVRDGMPKAINRALGTIAGFAIAYVAADLLGPGPALTLIGYGFAVGAVIAMVKHWHYAVYATLLTPAVVILESVGRSVQETSDHRLVATLLSVAISLAVMAIAILIDRLLRNRLSSSAESTSGLTGPGD